MKVVTTLRFDLTLHSYYGENSDEVWGRETFIHS